MSADFQIESPFQPAGDQPQAIKELCEGINNGVKDQVLLGVQRQNLYYGQNHRTMQTSGLDYGAQ